MKTSFLIPFLFTAISSFAQWQETTVDTTYFHERISFANSNTGIVVGLDGTIQRTSDGGITWDTTSIQTANWLTSPHSPYPADMQAVYFLNDTVGYIGTDDGDIFKTFDAGLSWSFIGLVPTIDDIEDLHFFDSDTGLAITYSRVFRTTNGGATWTSQISITPTWFPWIESVNDSTVLISGAKIRRSSDYGRTWTVTNHDTTIGFQDISMGDDLHGVAVSWAGKVITTNDGGLNWSNPLQIATVRISNVEMRNDSFGIITLGDSWENNWQQHDIGYVMYTLDGGQTWLQPDTIGTKTMSDLFMTNDSTAFACGWLGNVMKCQHIIRPISGVGILEKDIIIALQVFPNPVSQDQLYANIPGYASTHPAQMFITDISGQVVREIQMVSVAPYEINVESLTSGIYFLHCLIDGRELISKFIVQ